jgi:hypothetical protein
MMRSFILIASLLTAGCYVDVDGYLVNSAYKACKDHDGVSKITLGDKAVFDDNVTCLDGTRILIKRTQISEQPAPAALKIGQQDNPAAVWPRPLGPLQISG